MGLSRAEILQSVRNNLKYRDNLVLPDGDYEDQIEDSVITYSRHRPQRRVARVSGAQVGLYELPAAYEDGFSEIIEIEYPINEAPKAVIDPKNWYTDDTEDGLRLRFDFGNPGLGRDFLLKYTARHTSDSMGNTSVPASDREVFSWLVTANICLALASFYGGKANPSLPNAEVVEYANRVEEWTNLGIEWQKKFDKYVVTNTTGYYGSLDWVRDPFWDRRQD